MANKPSVLVPVAVLQGEALSEALVELLSNLDVTLLGYHEIPEQTATGQAHDQFNEQLQTKLEEYVDLFENHGGTVTPRTVFTHNAPETFERIAIELDVRTILIGNPAPTIERVLVPIRGPVNLDSILTTTASLVEESTDIVLFHAAASDDERASGETLLADAAEQLEAAGINPARLDRQLTVTDTPLRAINEYAADTGLVVIGEKDPSVVDIIFGDVATRIAEASASPVLVVRKDHSGDE